MGHNPDDIQRNRFSVLAGGLKTGRGGCGEQIRLELLLGCATRRARRRFTQELQLR